MTGIRSSGRPVRRIPDGARDEGRGPADGRPATGPGSPRPHWHPARPRRPPGPHPAQGRRRRARRLAGRADRRGPGHQPHDGGPHPPTVRRRGAGPHPAQAAGQGPAVPQAGRPAGGRAGRPGLLGAAGRARPVDHDPAGRPAGRTGGGRGHRPGHRLADASKNELKPWLKQQWVIPPRASGAFAAAMEDVIGVYHRPYDAAYPQVCVDEGGKQLVGDVREPLPVRPGSAAKEDSEYARHGTANLFMAFEPLAGRRVVAVTDRRTAVDFARFLKRLLDEVYPAAERVVLVTDNLDTHGPGSLYEAFDPAEARRLAGRLEWHYTPKHGSWL